MRALGRTTSFTTIINPSMWLGGGDAGYLHALVTLHTQNGTSQGKG